MTTLHHWRRLPNGDWIDTAGMNPITLLLLFNNRALPIGVPFTLKLAYGRCMA